ncbi:TadA family conjugal transfer-associated ATPase [Micrococcales bacterium 31B]|nr:TadA family conjugal transfer-associated ATPase [Micrococcales bacterium 31B]
MNTLLDISDLLRLTQEDLLENPGAVDVARTARLLRRLGRVAGSRDLLELTRRVRAEVTGYGPLQALIGPTTTDILVNGPHDVWFESGHGLERAPQARFADKHHLRNFATRLAASAGRRLDDAAPYVDARLPDGVRYHAILRPLGVQGPFVSLRFPAQHPISLETWLADEPAELLQIVRLMVTRRIAFLISGGTGSGKTTLLAAMLSASHPDERIIVVEDSTELMPQHPHVIHLQARQPNVEGNGGIDLSTLVRQTLRMRPDRVVLGECRGAEMRELLQALNTGHEGGCGTLHANTAHDVPARLESLGALAGLTPQAMASQAHSALDAIIHVERDELGRRHIAEIASIERNTAGLLSTTSILTLTDRRITRGPAWDHFALRLGWSAC